MSVNKVILVGRLGADPESRTTGSGTTVTKLRLATSERQKDRDGNWGEHTEWHRVTCFGRTAENAARFLSKGRQVYLEGGIRTSKYQDRDGNDRWSTEVIADILQFLGGREGGGGGGGGYSGGGGGGGYPPSDGGGDNRDSGGGAPDYGGADDDIPF